MHIYVLSTGRAGTNFLSKQFNTHFPHLKLTHQQQGSRIINIVANLPLTNSVYLSFLGLLFKLFGRGYPPHSTIDPLLSLAIFKLIKYGRIARNNCLIVHLVRNPGAFVTSFMNWKRQSFKRTILHHLVPFWNPIPFHGISFISRLKMSKFENFCWVWNYKNACFLQLREQNYILLRMEDLLKAESQKRTIETLASFFRLEMSKEIFFDGNEQINKSNPKKFSAFQKWTQQEKKIMYKHCSALSKIMKYE